MMGEAHFSGARDRSASDQTRARDRVVRRAKWPDTLADAGVIQNPCDGMYGDDLERLIFGQRWQNGGHSPREHRLARAWWSDQQHVVPARRGDLQRALCSLLSDDVGKISCVDFRAGGRRVSACGSEISFAQLLHELS